MRQFAPKRASDPYPYLPPSTFHRNLRYFAACLLPSLRLFFCAGEPSGDLHAANLIASCRSAARGSRPSDTEVRGWRPSAAGSTPI